MQRLLCKAETDEYFTQGKLYGVITRKVDCFVVIDDEDNTHYLTVEPDSHGVSYKTWFELVEADGEEAV